MTHSAYTFRGIAMAAAVLVAGCGSSSAGATKDAITTATHTTAATSPAPAIVVREQARAARAVDVLARALRDGDVERLCRPGAVFTSAVVAEMNGGPQGCEQDVELTSIVARPPTLTVVPPSSYEPDLATLRVRVGRGATVPLDVVRERRVWLVSFSDGNDPLTALAEG
ncbi:MAG: hypothetical protein QOD83_3339 [Solirubrobacteraceae bacterium]|nr:hypothetical protein [Solirubrobacteraceae bacterium]